ncbi:sensor histidine kinase [Scrofimicrobium canadense]|uniref:sensor histidine kinase n=1 Tax=Scrofimicrobium canadense TaxID=2652290 RepID=UPI00198098BB|nr:HAMP domain-containing sensor histidine kinase [Scrofimicrobium canadense]
MAIGSLILLVTALLSLLFAFVMQQALAKQAEKTLYLAQENLTNRIINEGELDGQNLVFTGEENLIPPPDGFYLILSDNKVVFSSLLSSDFTLRRLRVDEIATVLSAVEVNSYSPQLRINETDSYAFLASPVVLDGPESPLITAISGVGVNDGVAIVEVFLWWELIAGAISAGLGVFIAYRLIVRSLAPLETVVAVADKITSTPLEDLTPLLADRVRAVNPDSQSEADRVSLAFNDLLSHVGQALSARHRAEDSMRRFLADVSHELRNPLSSIRGYSELYADDESLDPDVRFALDRIHAESQRMNRLVESLILLAKLDSGPTLSLEEIDLIALVKTVFHDARIAYPEHQWQEQLPDSSIVIIGNSDALGQIILNLLSNSHHHTQEGSLIELSVHCDADAVHVRVSDNGPGIPQQAQEMIFDRFSQVPPGTEKTRNRGTLGLGLAIAQSLAKAQGFTITVDSNPGHTTFTLVIPTNLRK